VALDLEEQEQLAELKSWWKTHGNLVVAVIVGAAVAFAGWRYWKIYQANQATHAAVLFETVGKATVTGDAKALRDAAGSLVENYPRTLYASMGALVAARYYYDHNDPKSAKAQLQWVIERSSADDLRDLARLRLAAVLLDEKAYDEALKQLDASHGAAYDSQYAAMKGDILVAQGKPAEAKAAYKLALDKAGPQDAPLRETLRMRLDALGG
jgi:predicted negative regulator of RcsB-dependent stress response